MSANKGANIKNIDLVWKRVVADDVTAFRILFDTYYNDLVSFSHRYTQQQAVSEEIIQEIFISLWERRKVISIEASLKAYLYRSVRNRTINYLKNQLPKDQKTTAIESEHGLTVTQEYHEENNELAEQIDRAIASLPEKCRIIFLLSRNEGLTHKEIAAELDISVKTIENQIGIALKKLRAALQPFLNTPAVLLLIEIVFSTF
ncbi:MAG: RNA polymerase sigma-70 factor [Cyclobacteriaceae bacterium]